MSYDLKIYTIKKQDFNLLTNQFNLVENNEGYVLAHDDYQIVISREIKLDDEDIAQDISSKLPGIKYLIECSLEPITNDEKKIEELIKIGKAIAKNGVGLIENPQTKEVILPRGIKRVYDIEKTERFSIIKLSWWFNHNPISNEENIEKLLIAIKRHIPEALARRYGLYEPPKEIFTTLDVFKNFIIENYNGIVWYPNKPVEYVNLAIPNPIGPAKIGYRFSHFSISIDAGVLSMAGWETEIIRLFKSISEVLNPFYGDIFILNNYIRSRTILSSDDKTEKHPIMAWWWNGIPKKSGLALVLGTEIHKYLKINREYDLLNNDCKLFIKNKEKENDELYKGIQIPKNLYQPQESFLKLFSLGGFSGKYPKIWPFEGPKRK